MCDLPGPEICVDPGPTPPALADRFFITESPGKPPGLLWLALHPSSLCPAASHRVLPLSLCALDLYTVFSPGHWSKLPFTCRDTSHWVRAHSTLQPSMMSSWLHLQRPCCQIKTHRYGSWELEAEYLFWGQMQVNPQRHLILKISALCFLCLHNEVFEFKWSKIIFRFKIVWRWL